MTTTTLASRAPAYIAKINALVQTDHEQWIAETLNELAGETDAAGLIPDSEPAATRRGTERRHRVQSRR